VFRFSFYLSMWDIRESPSSWTVSYSDLVTSLYSTVTVEFMTLTSYIFLSEQASEQPLDVWQMLVSCETVYKMI